MVVAASSPLADVITTTDDKSPSLGCASSVPCSICFDLVIDDGDRNIRFTFAFEISDKIDQKHTLPGLDNVVESGRWLFANGSAHGISEDDTLLDLLQTDFPHDLSHSRRLSFTPANKTETGKRMWFSLLGLPGEGEEAESSLNTFPNFYGNRAMTIENISAPSSARSHISHFRPNEHIGNSNFSHHHHPPMNAHSAPHDTLRSTNIQHPSWGWNCHFIPYSDREFIEHNNQTPVNTATLRPTHARAQADAAARSSSFPHPLRYSQQPIARPGERSVANSQPTETTNIPSSGNGFRRFSGARGMPMIMPAVPNHIYFRSFGGSLYFRDMERDESFSHAVPAGYRRVSRSSYSSNRAQWF
ncbi:hypothetical protein Tco_0591814 [Tanacetum coccineum]